MIRNLVLGMYLMTATAPALAIEDAGVNLHNSNIDAKVELTDDDLETVAYLLQLRQRFIELENEDMVASIDNHLQSIINSKSLW